MAGREDVQLDGVPPKVRARIASAKNRKEEFVQLIPEIEELFRDFRPANFSPSERVFAEN
jgi:hypothetical protein